MEKVQIFWDPSGIELDQLGKKTKSGDPADGDTPYVRMPIRMLGIDTPETSYQGGETTANNKLNELKTLLETGNFDSWIDPELKGHMAPRLVNAGTRQITQGNQAKTVFKQLLDTRLAKPNGTNRSLFVMAADEHFDRYGRLLAYIAPSFTKTELATVSLEQRKTFNLLLLESGWASSIIIYPNLPKNSDLRLARTAVKNAVENNLGAWADPLMLTAYEYRMCIKLYNACKKAKASNGFFIRESDWVQRYCIDMTTLKVYNPQQYLKVKPENRLFIWPFDIRDAVGELNLIAAE
ncbi:MAG: nuclease [Muricauda sp.]|nr:thermonuclease family protein [Allomuricauda sp.]MAU26230.1 nuclease [Allomuricauda sp.]MBC29277.1 nuclease [Allomuricauda sp.]|tara:strand:+ start:39141 stop:40022 length:882 start_codon:yes stop_codon:yes gene_type:complete